MIHHTHTTHKQHVPLTRTDKRTPSYKNSKLHYRKEITLEKRNYNTGKKYITGKKLYYRKEIIIQEKNCITGKKLAIILQEKIGNCIAGKKLPYRKEITLQERNYITGNILQYR